MIDLFLPFVIGLAAGIEPSTSETTSVEQEEPSIQVATTALGSGDDLTANREPESQMPTGKYTTAMEVRPILGMTKSNWIGVREFNGQDLIYFTHLMAWRCGLWDIRYGINGEPATNVVPMEPCYDDMAQPNVMTDVENYLPYVAYPLQSIESVYVEIVFDDGTSDFAQFNRAEVQIP